MPAITRWHLKTALVYFAAALAVGVAIASRGVFGAPAVLGLLGPTYWHLLTVGWVTQLICGVALWMFPKFSAAQPRGEERLSWLAYGLLNAGLAVRVFSEPLMALQPAEWLGWLLALAAVLQWLAGLLYVANLWRRVKEK